MAQRSPRSSSNNCPTPTKKEAKICDLVGILINDPALLENWSQFCDKLDSPKQDKVRWDRGIKNGTSPHYDVFSEMLDIWVGRNSHKKTVDNLCSVLRGIQCVAVSEKLESEFNKDEIIQQSDNSKKTSAKKNVFLQNGKEINWPLKHGFFVPTRKFAGREKQLEEIQTNFISKNNLMLITGFGGIGKTELCRKFAHKICKSVIFRVPSCVWLHGENLETLRDSILKLATELGITNEGNPTVLEYFEYIASFILEKKSHLLLVIDNVDVSYEEVLNIINIIRLAKYEKMFLIVTSRDSNVLQGAGFTMQLDVLSKSKARSMLKSSMSDLSDSDADKLGKLVQYFPLALQQALDYIKQQRKHYMTNNYSVSDFVSEFEVKKSQMLGHKLNELDHDYSKTTLVTWNMTISKMSDGAVKILKILAYLDADGVELKFLENVCTRMGVVDFDMGLNLLCNYCLVKIEDNLFTVDKVISVHRLVQEVMRGKVDNNYPERLFDTVFLVRWKLLSNKESPSNDVHLKSVFKFAWKCQMQEMLDFTDALFFLLDLGRIGCAEKLTKLNYPYFQFSSEFEVEKKEFLEKVVLWCFVCGDSRKNSEEIAKCEFNVDWKHVKHVNFYPLETLEGCLKLSQKHFGESSKITFVLKSLLVQKLSYMREFDKAFQLCEELATFPFDEDDNGQANFLYQTIREILPYLDKEKSPPGTLEQIMNHLGKFYTKDSIEWMELEARLCDLKGDYKKALELFKKLFQEGNKKYEYKIIELKIKLVDSDMMTVEEFVREFSEVDFDKHAFYFTLQKLEKFLTKYEANLGDDHELISKLKLTMARRLQYVMVNTKEKNKCIKLCEEILRSKFDEKYEQVFHYLCKARDIQEDYDEQRKFLQNLLESKQNKLGKNHSNTKVALKLLNGVPRKYLRGWCGCFPRS